MCGRFNLRATPAEIQDFFDLLRLPEWTWRPRYNIAPSQAHPIIRQTNDRHECVIARWGLIPSWATDRTIGYRLINARAETVAEKPSFRAAFRHRRCLIPTSGFYEWKKRDAKTKQPFHIHRKDDSLFAFAGLWERWEKGTEPVESFTIITTAANALLRPLHDRMPAILPRELFSVWLDAEVDPTALHDLLSPRDDEALEAYPVNPLVGNVKNDGPECIEAVP